MITLLSRVIEIDFIDVFGNFRKKRFFHHFTVLDRGPKFVPIILKTEFVLVCVPKAYSKIAANLRQLFVCNRAYVLITKAHFLKFVACLYGANFATNILLTTIFDFTFRPIGTTLQKKRSKLQWANSKFILRRGFSV